MKGIFYHITGINPEAVKWGDDHYDRLLCPGLQPGPPSQTTGGLGQRYWSVSEVTWPPKLELRRWRSSGPSSVMRQGFLIEFRFCIPLVIITWSCLSTLTGLVLTTQIEACYYTPRFNEVERGVYWFHVVRPSARLSVRPSVEAIVSAAYLQQYSLDPFHIHTSYQATSKGALHLTLFVKFQNLNVWQTF